MVYITVVNPDLLLTIGSQSMLGAVKDPGKEAKVVLFFLPTIHLVNLV